MKSPRSIMRFVGFVLLCALPALHAGLALPAIFSDHMVLQRDREVPIWGTSEPGEKVTVTFGENSVSSDADSAGKWQVKLQPLQANVSAEMKISGSHSPDPLVIKDVAVGEVWFASGQSNMWWTLGNLPPTEDIKQPTDAFIRQFRVSSTGFLEPQSNCKGQWQLASPETRSEFSAVGYYFARELQRELKVPVGIINASVGGTPVEAWTSRTALDSIPALKEGAEKHWAAFNAFPEKRRQYLKEVHDWLARLGREDIASPDASPYISSGFNAADWQKVKLPGPIEFTGFSGNGVIWLRREVEVPSDAVTKIRWLRLYATDGFPTVYWNGRALPPTTVDNHPGKKAGLNYELPPGLVTAGVNTLAIRIYSPFVAAAIPDGPRAQDLWLGGDWLAKCEREFPALDTAELAQVPEMPDVRENFNLLPASLFNGLVAPIQPYAIKGAIWYQGENNTRRAWQYRTAFPLMIQDWRACWKQGDFPFYFCQLANNAGKSAKIEESIWAELREAQSQTLALPNTGQAVLIDIGEGDIHPTDKIGVGNRLARLALAKDYDKQIVWSGPIYRSMTVEKDRLRLSFDHLEGGLEARPVPETFPTSRLAGASRPLVRNSPDSQLEGFMICGEDHQWVWAEGSIDGDSVIVSSAKVPVPVAVRYNWENNPSGNLYNRAGLPAAPFRTDDFPVSSLKETL